MFCDIKKVYLRVTVIQLTKRYFLFMLQNN